MDCNLERPVGASVAPDENWLQGLKHSKSPQKNILEKDVDCVSASFKLTD